MIERWRAVVDGLEKKETTSRVVPNTTRWIGKQCARGENLQECLYATTKSTSVYICRTLRAKTCCVESLLIATQFVRDS